MKPSDHVSFAENSPSNSRPLRMVGLGVLLVAAGTILLVLALPGAWEGLLALGWTKVPGVVLRAGHGTDFEYSGNQSSRNQVEWLDLRYAWTTRGPNGTDAHHSGSRFDASRWGEGRRNQVIPPGFTGRAREVMASAPAVVLRVDPEVPSRAVVRPGVPVEEALLLLLAASLLGGAQALVRGALWGDPGEGRQDLPRWLLWYPIVGVVFTASLAGILHRHTQMAPPSWPLLGYTVVAGVIHLGHGWSRSGAKRSGGGTTPERFAPVAKSYGDRALGYFTFGVALLGVVALIERARVNPGDFYWKQEDALLVRWLDHPNPAVRETAAWEVFQRMGPVEAVPGLGRNLEAPEEDVRRAAVAALRLHASKAAPFESILERMAKDDPDERCRANAAALLKDIRALR